MSDLPVTSIMSLFDTAHSKQIHLEPNRPQGHAPLARFHRYNGSDRYLDPRHFRFLSRLGTETGLPIDEDPAEDHSWHDVTDEKPDLRAVESPLTLFQSSESMNDLLNRFPVGAWKSPCLQYYLQQDDGVKARLAGLEQLCNDTTGLLSNHQKHPRRPWHSDLRAILPGLLVIDCFSMRVVSADPSSPYVALSYVWGEDAGGGEKKGFKTDLRGQPLPQTIRDAMNVVRVLGMKYLWVDRCCIDDSEPGTKHHTINNMDAIYEAAHLTIIAACGRDAEHGLPSVSRTLRCLDEDTTPPWNGIVYSDFSDPHLRQFQNSKYKTRGWTFQEDLLSQRRLIFTNERATLYYREKDRISASSGIFAHINEYSQRSLGYSSDSLRAFLGVFRAYERLQAPVKHIWGVPFLLGRDGNMVQPGYGLLWKANQSCSLRRIQGLPSWTWAGWGSWSIDSRESKSGPYLWLEATPKQLRRKLAAPDTSDISIEVLVGGQPRDISDHFRAVHTPPPPGDGVEPAPVLYLTAWSTTVNVRISLQSACVHFSDKDLKAAESTVDPTADSLYRDEPQSDGHWSCQWTAAVICWRGAKDDVRAPRTQCLLLERVGDDNFRRVGVLQTDWQKADLDEDWCIVELDRSFSRKRFRIE